MVHGVGALAWDVWVEERDGPSCGSKVYFSGDRPDSDSLSLSSTGLIACCAAAALKICFEKEFDSFFLVSWPSTRRVEYERLKGGCDANVRVWSRFSVVIINIFFCFRAPR